MNLLTLFAEPQSAPVTQLTERLLWTALMLALVAGCYLLMWRGWRQRGARQLALLPPLPTEPDPGAGALAAADGVYVSSTSAGDWLDRVVAHGLGQRSRATLTVTAAGVCCRREGAPTLYVPAGQLRGVGRGSGLAGKFVTGDGLLFLDWAHADQLLRTGFRADRLADHDQLEAAVRQLLAETSPPAAAPDPAPTTGGTP